MERLGSRFLEDFIKEEKPGLFGLTNRLWLLVVGLVLSLALLVYLFWLGIPDFFVILVALFFVVPIMVFGLSFDKRFSLVERFYFGILVKKRVYQTEQTNVKEYKRSDFIQEKGTSETDQF